MYLQHLRATVLSVLILFSQQILSQTRTESETVFAIGSNDVGSLENSVNLFTGDVEFPMTLISNMANGGIQMRVGVSYNSDVNLQTQTWNRESPTSVVGLGWSMNIPKIVVDNKETGTRKDDEFFLVEGGSTPLIYNHSVLGAVTHNNVQYNAKIYKTTAHNNWDIYYVEELEYWEIVRDDGTILIYGDKINHPTAVEWVVHWDNWIGNSAVTTGQSRQAMVWNLAEVSDLWGNYLTYTYDKVEQRVSAGSGGMYHTEASYLSDIEDGIGNRIELTYAEKNNYEYYEPHTEINYNASTNVAEPDGYQERYERKYLSELRSYNEFNQLLKKVTLDYTINGTGDYRKRYLWRVTHHNAEGEAALPTEFSYNFTQAGYKGAMIRVTSPTGSYIQYNYNGTGHEIGNSGLDITLYPPTGPAGYEMPQVYHGNNYAVVAWRNPNTQLAIVQIYDWDGYWNMVETRFYHNVGRITNANPHIQPRYTNLQIVLEKDFVGIVHRYSNNTYLYAYSRNPDKQEWVNYSKTLSTEANIQLVSGDRFIALQEQTKGTLHAIRWDGEGWDYDLVMPEIVSNFSQYYYATAGTNFVSVHNPQIARRGPSISNYTFFLAESGLWSEKTGPLVDIAYNNDRTWHAVNATVFGIKSVGSEIAFDWDVNYNLKNTYTLTSYGTTTSNRFISIGNSLVSFNDKANAGNVNFNSMNAMYMSRFDGTTWRTIGSNDYWAEFSAIGRDYLLSGSGRLHRYNPNTSSWSSYVNMPGASTSNRKPALSLPNATYYWPYFRKFNNNGSYLDIYIPSAASNRGKDETHQAGGNFVIQNRFSSGLGVYMHYLKNNQVVSNYISSKRVPEFNNIAAGLDQFHLYTTSSSSDTYEEANSITLYKVKSDLNANPKFQGKLKDYPVSYITHYDGVNNRYTSFDFEEGTAKMDASGSKALYAKATTFHGSSNKSSSIGGKTITNFYNGMPLSYTHPHRNGSNEDDYDQQLVGRVYKTQTFRTNSEIASTYTYFKVIKKPISNFQGTLAMQTLIVPTASVNKQDGVQTIMNYYYNSLYQLNRTQTSYSSGYVTRYIDQYQYYIWEYYPTAAQQYNLLSPVVFTKGKEGSNWISASVNTWKDWGSGRWAPRTTYNWKGTGGSPSFTSWTGNGTVTNWERTKDITARNPVGKVQETRDVNDHYSATRYGYSDEFPMLTVFDAKDHEIFADDFNDGNLTSGGPVNWYGNTWSNQNGVISSNSTTSTEKTLSMTSYYSGTSFIAEYDARVRSSNYGSWVGFRMKGTSYTAGNGEYLIKYFPNVGIVQLLRNGTTLVSSGYMAVPNLSDWKHFRIERHYNSIFQVYVDDKLALSYYVSGSGTGGYFGFSAYGSCSVEVDNFRMYPHLGIANSTTYDKTFKTIETSTDEYGSTTRTMYNDWQESVSSINAQGIPKATYSGSSSRFRSNSNYMASDPGVGLVTTVNGLDGFFEDFSTTNPRWYTESYSNKSVWYHTNGKLALWSFGANTVSTPDAYKIDFGKDFSGRIGVEFDVRQRDNTGNRGFGVAIGDGSLNQNSSSSAIQLSFRGSNSLDYCNSSNCTPTSGWSTVTSQVHYSKQHRVKIILDTDTDKADVYVNGKLYVKGHPFRKASSVIRRLRFLNYGRGSATEWKVDNLVIYEDPVHYMSFTDASGKTIQSQTEEPDNKVMVSETFYDQLGRKAITAKSTRTSTTAQFGYRAGFITNGGTSPPTNLYGEVKTWNNNDNYAFSRTKYETSPLGRVLEESRPGYLYRIGGGENPVISYGANSSLTSSYLYMGTGYSANTYNTTTVTDSDGSRMITFRDKLGRVAMEKEGPVEISTVLCSPNEVVDTRYFYWYLNPTPAGYSAYTPDQDVTATISLSNSNPAAKFQIGTALYSVGLYNLLSVSASGTYTVNLTAGQTIYFNWTAGISGFVNIVFTCNSSDVIEKEAYLTTKYEYNSEGELVKIYHPNYFDLPPSGGTREDFTTTYTYDDRGNMITSTTPDGGTTKYLYDDHSRLRFKQDANGAASGYVSYYEYDTYDRITEEGYWYRSWTGLTATTSVPSVSTWRKRYYFGSISVPNLYEKNRLREVQVNNDESNDVEVYEKYTYDIYGRVIDHQTRVVDFDNTYHTVSYTYDNNGKVLSTDYGQGFSPVLYNYYKENGALMEIGSSSYSSEYAFYTYDKNGYMEYEYLDWKTKPFKFNYDISGRLTNIDDINNYYYDQVISYNDGYGGTNNTGLINKVNNNYKTSSIYFNSLSSKPSAYQYRYAYDQIGQLKVADHNTASGRDIGIYLSRTTQYDANGNTLRRQEGSGNASYNQKRFSYHPGTNQIKNTSGSTGTSQTYDANGNQISNLDNYASMQYDKGFDKIDYYTRYGSYSWYQYGANNQRILKRADPAGSAPEVKTMYIHAQSDYPLFESINDNGTIRKRFYIYGLTGIVASNIENIDYYHVKDYQGSTRVLFRQGGTISAWYDYLPYGNLAASYNSNLSTYRYTGQEYDNETGIHNYRARLYDARLGSFYSMDPAGQFASPYLAMGNDPINMIDPDGEVAWFVPLIVGAGINTIVQSATGNINNFGDFALSLGVGALSGYVGYGASQFVSGALGSATSLGGAIFNGAISGAAGGFSGGFIRGAGNAWAGGANFSDGLGAGLRAAGQGALTNGLLGGISAGINFNKQTAAFRRGNDELGIQSDDPVPATDDFLKKAQEAWYKDAPMESVNKFTVENVSAATQAKLDNAGAGGLTARLTRNGILSGRSNVYFNKNNAFTSAKRLYYVMGHEFVHVSQFASLAGQSSNIITRDFIELMEYHAYSYENTVLGSSNYGGFDKDQVKYLLETFPEYFSKMSYTNFSWTQNHSFVYPFK